MSSVRLLYGLGFALLGACQAAPTLPSLSDDNGSTIVEAAPTLTPEERALANQLANRSLLQAVIDGNEGLERLEFPFSCAPQEGGLAVQLSDSNAVQSWRLARTTAHKQEVVHWYYRKERLNFVAYEESRREGGDEEVTQTLFYTKNNSVFHCQRKTARATTMALEEVLQQATRQPIAVDTALWQRIQAYETRLQQMPLTEGDWATEWCRVD